MLISAATSAQVGWDSMHFLPVDIRYIGKMEVFKVLDVDFNGLPDDAMTIFRSWVPAEL